MDKPKPTPPQKDGQPQVMDIMPPTDKPTEPGKPQPSAVPVDQPVPAPAPEATPAKAPIAVSAQPPVVKQPKPQGSGIGAAIVATVVIALGLGALMVYAYLRTK